MHKLYDIINKLAPKRARGRTQLKGPNGEILDAATELEAFRSHLQELYTEAPHGFSSEVHESHEHFSWSCVSEEALEKELQRVTIGKAVPPHLAPASL